VAKVSAIVLAAGTSSRMGGVNKLFLDFQGKTIIQWVIENVIASYPNEVVVVGSELSMERLVGFNYRSIRLVENKDYELGMTRSIQSGVKSSNANSDGYMICLGDQPTIEPLVYSQLIHVFESADKKNKKSIVVPFHKMKQGNPVIFSSYYKQEILIHEVAEGCKGILDKHYSFVKRIDVKSSSILRDVDTKGDYEAL